MRTIIVLCLVAACCSAKISADQKCEPSATRSSTVKGPICKGALIFEDNFDFLDLGKWSHEVTMAGGGNNEFQVYWADPANSFTSNGNLNIHPGKLADIYGNDFLYSGTLDLGPTCTIDWNWGCSRTGNSENILNPATSARLHTVNTFGFTYGIVEARARIPAGDWIWPAIWMMPRYSVYGGWPASGEIDIMESRGNREFGSFGGAGVNIGVEQVGSTMHWGPDPSFNRWYLTHWERNTEPGNGYNNDFHLYQVEWTPDYIKFSVDNVELGTIAPPAGGFYELGGFANEGVGNPWGASKMAPFDQEFYLILNVAVGGTNYFPDGIANPGGKPWSNTSPTAFRDFWEGRGQWEPTWQGDTTDMLVDYVRVWAL
ncbi:beta-1,3-glucan-binding protein-like [Cloeon dipterum]|uniref:beta-1,3-glucan-binding protein-like n=1 Tax=Cloeon dipterum TaxID=197152 RepID=UPI00321FA711